MPHLLRRTTSVTGVAALLLAATAAGATAGAHAADEPAPLEVAVTGPATGDAGGTGDYAVVLRNTGAVPAGEVRLRPQLPEGITVLAVGATGSWTCVLGPLRCTLPAGLAAGATSEALPVALHYDGLVEGRQEVGFLVQQGAGPVRVDSGRTTVDVTGAPDWTLPPEEQPAPAQPAPAAPAPAIAPAPAPASAPAAAPAPAPAPAPAAPAAPAPAPAAPAPAAPAPAPVPAAVVPDPAPAPAAAAVEAPALAVDPGPADPAPVPVAPAPAPAVEPEAPAVLPFADDEQAGPPTGSEADGVASTVPVASAVDGAEGLYTALLAVVFGVLLLAWLYLVGRVVAQRRALA